jgi:hypothetical protein
MFDSRYQKSQHESRNIPAIAYQNHGILRLVTISGDVLQTVKVNPSIGTFAISRDAKKVLFTPLPKDPTVYGGELFILHFSSSIPKRLSQGPYYNKSSRPVEVYSDPDFSPDGMRAVFSVHSQPSGDLMQASGPFAIVDLKTGHVSVLPATLHVPGEQWGTGFARTAYWSPDGQTISLNFEDGFFLADPQGKHLESLSPFLTEADWTSSIGWIGSQCIAYVGGKDYIDARQHPARFLNIKTHETGPLEKLLGVNAQQVTDLVAIVGTTRVRWQGKELLVEFNRGKWSIPNADRRTQVRILPSSAEAVPETCR